MNPNALIVDTCYKMMDDLEMDSFIAMNDRQMEFFFTFCAFDDVSNDGLNNFLTTIFECVDWEMVRDPLRDYLREKKAEKFARHLEICRNRQEMGNE